MNPFADLRGLDATAPRTGPFPGAAFLGVWWVHRGSGEALACRVADGGVALVVDGPTATLAGEADLTDYHSPLGADPVAAITAALTALPAGTRLAFDSLPVEALEPFRKACAIRGVEASVTAHTAAMVLDLPDDPEAYLASLDAKQRHEVRRKRRRFSEALGAPTLTRDPGGFDDFVRMHRSADGDKGGFMTPEMEGFFADLLDDAGAVLDVLRGGDGAPVAAAFGFEDGDTYYLYNSAFDPGKAAASPGIVLVYMAIEAAITAGRRRFDFLKGDESYKLRLGARPRALHRLEATL